MVDAVPELVKPASVALFAHQGVFTEKGIHKHAYSRAWYPKAETS